MLRTSLVPPLALLAGGCAAPPRAPDADATVVGLNFGLLAAPTLRIELVRINAVDVPADAVARALARVEELLNKPLLVTDLGRVEVPAGPDGALQRGFFWPYDAAGEPIDLASIPPSVLRINPAVTSDRVLLAFLPEESPSHPFYSAVTGSTRRLPPPPDSLEGGALVCLQMNVIERRSGCFVARDKLVEWTLTHELGHAIGLPASDDHACHGATSGTHCTHPECVMYSGRDWRVVWTALFHGWPLDFCARCQAEVEVRRE